VDPVVDRRTLLAGTSAILLAAPLAAEAQQTPKIARIGFLGPGHSATGALPLAPFRQGMRELGYVEGKSFAVEARYAEGRLERLPGLARELVGLKVNVIVTGTDAAIAAVKRETQAIPIVMANSNDPVGTGFVANLAHPGGNVTGLSTISPELSGKRLELLRETGPGLSRVAFLWNPDVRGNVLDYKEMESAARSQRLELQSVEVSRYEDLDLAFTASGGPPFRSCARLRRITPRNLLPGRRYGVRKRDQ
jgi:putative ABC transport system substrate-binding protein